MVKSTLRMKKLFFTEFKQTILHYCKPVNVSFIGIILCFYPIFCNYDMNPPVNEDSKLIWAFESPLYLNSLVASIAVSVPILLDYSIDFLYSNKQTSVSKGLIPRRDLILALLLPDIFILIYVVPYKKFEFLPVITHARELFYLYSFLTYMIHFCHPIWTHRTTASLPLLYGVSCFLACLAPFSSPRLSLLLTVAQYLLNLFLIIVFALLTIRWYIFLRESKDTNSFINNYQYNVYLFAILAFIFGDVIITFSFKHDNWPDTDARYLGSYTYFICLIAVTVSVLNGRIVRMDAAESEQALEIKKMFVRYISHEIRTPLNTVFLGLKLLEKETEKNSRTISTIRDIRSSCDVSLQILNDLLAFDKLESGLMTLETDHLSPWIFFRDTIHPFQIQAREAEVELVYESKDELPGRFRGTAVYGDPHKLSQVIRNLISNALKFTPRGGKVTVKMERVASDKVSDRRRSSRMTGMSGLTPTPPPITPTSAHGRRSPTFPRSRSVSYASRERDRDEMPPSVEVLRFSVSDTGAGISTRNQAKLFKSVVQFNPGKLQAGGGSGLGLYITKGIVDLHNGHISVESVGEGFGSTFIVEFPLYPIDEEEEDKFRSTLLRDRHEVVVSALQDDENVSVRSVISQIRQITNHITPKQSSQPSPSGSVTSVFGFGGSIPGSVKGSFTGAATEHLPSPHNNNTNRVTPFSLTRQMSEGLSSAFKKTAYDGLDDEVAEEKSVRSSGNGKSIPFSSVAMDSIPLDPKTNYMDGLGITDGCKELDSYYRLSEGRQSSSNTMNEITHSTAVPTTTATINKKCNILIADDSTLNRKMLVRLLTPITTSCIEVDNGQQLLTAVHQSIANGYDVDVILTDHRMPVMDGPHAIREIRKLGFKGLIVGITGDVLTCDKESFLKSGADHVMTKPLDIDTLQKIISDHLRRRSETMNKPTTRTFSQKIFIQS